jgi:hypothetical protein
MSCVRAIHGHCHHLIGRGCFIKLGKQAFDGMFAMMLTARYQLG